MTGTELLAALGALLNQALDLTPGERETWLARLRIEQPRTRRSWTRCSPRKRT
jgi:hypothetical protein